MRISESVKKTRYLSELASGDDVLIIDSEGETRPAVVGRVKIGAAR